MNFLHLSDIHLGSPFKVLSDENKRKMRKEELFLTLENSFNFGKENNCEVILICGDLFDKETVSKKDKARIYNLFTRFPMIKFFYCLGNHDKKEIFSDEDKPDNLFVFSDKFQTYDLGEVTISGINYKESLNKEDFDSLILDKDKKNIVMAHGDIFSPSYSLDLSLFKNKNIDYLALGHIHKKMEGSLDQNSKYFYSGCLEGRGFDEDGEKGFYLGNTDSILFPKFIKIAKRQLFKMECDISSLTSDNEIIKEIKKIIDDNKITKDDFIELTLKGEYSLDNENLKKDISFPFSNYFLFRIIDKTRIKFDFSKIENELSLSSEYIKKVRENEKDEELINSLLEIGIKLLKGEEIDEA